MRTTITTDDLAEIIYEHHYPGNFASSCGLSEKRIDAGYKGAKAQIQEYYFEGVRIQHGECSFREAMSISSKTDQPILKMLFNLSGRSFGQVNGFKTDLFINEYEHFLTYMPELGGCLHYEAATVTENLEIILTPAYFARFNNQECRIISQFTQAIEKQEPLRMPYNGKIDPLMKNTIRQLLQNPFQGSVRRLFVESKVLELFAAQLESFKGMLSCYERNHSSSKDHEKLHYAKKLLEARFQNPPTIYELSRLVGLNEFKLKKGFKELFDNTIFGYLTEYRLGFARQYLLDTDKPIASISDMIGYSYQQHFSTAFKRKYGVTPSEIRKSGDRL
ncbi:MAG: AraC family transcriptional regulator [Bacteroidota bacterium]